MFRALFVAALLAGPVVSARAADPAAVAAFEQFLRADEKAFLAAVLVDRTLSAEFDLDFKTAAGDAKLMKLMLDKWRGRIAEFALADAKRPNPNVDGTFKTYLDMMDPRMRAYMLRRLPTMLESDRNSLIGYLNDINEDLQDDGQLGWYDKKVVAAIFDHYRRDLVDYAATPLAKQGLADGPAAAAALAARRGEVAQAKAEQDKAAQLAAKAAADKLAADKAAAAKAKGGAPTPVAGAPGAAKGGTPAGGTPAAGTTPTAPVGGGVASAPESKTALEQAKNAAGGAAEAGERLGKSFDGGSGTGVPPVVPGSGSELPPLPASTGLGGGSGAGTAVAEPPAPPSDAQLLADISKMKTGKGAGVVWHKVLPGAAGALAGALIGLKLGGLFGALFGAVVGLMLGDSLGKKILHMR